MLSNAELLDRAVDAVNAWLDVRESRAPAGPYAPLGATTTSPEAMRAYGRAVDAVTEAVTRGGHIHTLITVRVGRCPGLTIVELIADDDARAKALAAERHAAQRYVTQVTNRIREEVLRRVDAGEEVRAVARMYGVNHNSVYAWMEQRAQEVEPVTPWDTATGSVTEGERV